MTSWSIRAQNGPKMGPTGQQDLTPMRGDEPKGLP